MKYILGFYMCFLTLPNISQEKFSKEISLITDNDLYVSINRDRYYTSGMFLNYSHLVNHQNEYLDKKIFHWQIGHQMYTPFKPIVEFKSLHDRPFAAYLFGKLEIKHVYKSNKILNTSVQIGLLGPNAKGDEIQNYIHKLYGYREVTGWKYQIKNAIGFNFGTEYIHFLGKNESNKMDVSWLTLVNVGTINTDVSSGMNIRLSFIPLQDIMNSIGFNTNLNNNFTRYKREIESFFYFKPMLRYALYDATIQGSFLNTSSEVTKELIPFVFDMEAGFTFTAQRFNFGYAFNYNTSKSKNLRYTNGNNYGTIRVSYLIH